MITKDQAERLVHDHINRPDPYWPDRPEMIVVGVDERDFGWVFWWTSRPWHETREFKHAIAGNGPILVSRDTGTLAAAGTAPPLEDRLAEAETKLREVMAGGPA